MAQDIAIKVEHVSKKFSKSLKRMMLYGMKDISRNMLRMSSHPGRLRKAEFWAVDDVSFTVKKGEILGIIGPNGSGKTTMLTMLNGIYWPDKGKIGIRGKTGALIALGAGFHPMLTGRENIYINGAILGLSRKLIDEKLEDIIEFADIGDFIDSPIKFYSSGMLVRLGFAIAINIEPEVLLIDEVLAVGDLDFRNKSMRRLTELKEKAHAVIFVSHRLDEVSRLCDRVLVLDKGKKIFLGETETALTKYYEIVRDKRISTFKRKRGKDAVLRESSGDVEIIASGLLNDAGKEVTSISLSHPLTIYFEFELKKDIEDVIFTVGVRDERGYNCIVHLNQYKDRPIYKNVQRGKYRLVVKFNDPHLVPGIYHPVLAIRNGVTNETYERMFDFASFSIEGNVIPHGIVNTESKWTFQEL